MFTYPASDQLALALARYVWIVNVLKLWFQDFLLACKSIVNQLLLPKYVKLFISTIQFPFIFSERMSHLQITVQLLLIASEMSNIQNFHFLSKIQ